LPSRCRSAATWWWWAPAGGAEHEHARPARLDGQDVRGAARRAARHRRLRRARAPRRRGHGARPTAAARELTRCSWRPRPCSCSVDRSAYSGACPMRAWPWGGRAPPGRRCERRGRDRPTRSLAGCCAPRCRARRRAAARRLRARPGPGSRALARSRAAFGDTRCSRARPAARHGPLARGPAPRPTPRRPVVELSSKGTSVGRSKDDRCRKPCIVRRPS
jgi:hypothetical protein